MLALRRPGGGPTLLLADFGSPAPPGQRLPELRSAVMARAVATLQATSAGRGGVEVTDRLGSPGLVMAFERAADALSAAIDGQRILQQHQISAYDPATTVADRAEHGEHGEHGELGERRGPPGPNVRMALHTVEHATTGDGDDLGTAIGRAAYLCAAGQRGQILVSTTTAELVADELPDGARLVDLGTHRLKDLGRPQRIWKVVHPALVDVTAPPRPLDAFPQNLPSAATPLIGRRSEVRTVVDLIGRERLVTLTGAAGVGKTRLAAQIGAELVDAYPGGVWWVDLAPIGDPTAVAPALLAAMGVSEDGLRPPLEVAVDRLAEGGAVMVVLDNCEHLSAEAASLAHALGGALADLVVLATSREPLGLPGEITWRVPSLEVPPPGPVTELAELERFDSVRLFMDRARRVRPNTAFGEGQAQAVAEICQRLDGIPLAIEFAAARCRQFSPVRIAAELSDRFRLLTGGSRAVLPRQQTLLASVEWSHDLLDDDERRVLRRLGVFSGPFPWEAVEVVVSAAADIERWTVLDVLGRLVDKNLVQLEADGHEGEYRLLETVRQFALDRSRESGELAGLRDAHADWWIATLRDLDARQPSAETIGLCARYAADLRSALDWLEPDLSRRYDLLALVALNWAWSGRADDVVAFVDRWLLDGPPAGHEVAWALAYGACGNVCYSAVQERAAPHNPTAIELILQAGDARALLALGIMLVADVDERTTLERSVAALELGAAAGADRLLSAFGPVFLLWISASDPSRAGRFTALVRAAIRRDPGPHDVYRGWLVPAGRTLSTDHLGRLPLPSFTRAETFALDRLLVADVASLVPLFTGDGRHLDASIEYMSRYRTFPIARLWRAGARAVQKVLAGAELSDTDALALTHSVGDAPATMRLAATRALIAAGRHDAAQALAGDEDEPRSAALQAIRDRVGALADPGSGTVAQPLARSLLALHRGDVVEADRQAGAAVAALETFRWDDATVDTFEVLAVVASRHNDHGRAARLLGAAATVRERAGYAHRLADQQRWIDALTADAGARLGADAWQEEQQRGRELALDEAIAYARRPRSPRRRLAAGWDSLTPTERDVARLVADGLTNPQIAERLLMSRSTVKTHVAHILAKTSTTSRTEMSAAYARRTGTAAVTDPANHAQKREG